MKLSKTDVGEAARQMIGARLMLSGAKVFAPLTEDTTIDLLVMDRDRFLKCQCKLIYAASNGCHKMNLFSIRKNGPNSKAQKHKYTKEEVDFFLGYCIEDDAVYVIPFEAAEGRQELRFWITRQPASNNNNTSTFDSLSYKNKFEMLSWANGRSPAS